MSTIGELRGGDDEDFFKVVETESFKKLTTDSACSYEESTGITEVHSLKLWRQRAMEYGSDQFW